MQYAPLAFPGLIVLILINLAFYGACLTLIVTGLRGVRRGLGHLVYVALGIAPFVYYACVYLLFPVEEAVRAREVAAWPRKPVTSDTLPKILVVEGGIGAPGLAKEFVAAGPFEKAYGNGGFDGWFVYERSAEPGCPARDAPRDRTAWLLPDRCATAGKSPPPAIDEPYLRLLLDLKASYYKTGSTTGVTAGSILELRWSDNAGGEIVAFHERPTFHVLEFPPMLTFSGFIRKEYTPGRYEPQIEPRKFVFDAIDTGRDRPR